jgi:hypothetical protein
MAWVPRDILCRSPRRRNGFITRVRLFSFGADDDHPALVANFESVCRERGIKLDQRGYSERSFIYAAECQTVADVEALSRIIGVRSISHMPLVRTIRPRMMNQQALPALPTRDAADADVPVVVVVDGGISDQIPALNSWVVGRVRDVSPPYDQNTDHGTFVAGLVCWGRELNPTVGGLDSGACAVFDLQVIPNDDPSRGETSALLESELLSSLESALPGACQQVQGLEPLFGNRRHLLAG